MTTDEYVPTTEALLDHYEELSLTVSRDPEAAKENRRIAEKSLARVRRDAAREALDGYAGGLDALVAPFRHLEGDRVRHWRDTHYPEESP